MRRSLTIVFLIGAGCSGAIEANGQWSSTDASVMFYDWDGGAYWGARSILLRHSSLLFDDDCSRFATQNSRLTWVKPFAPNTVVVQNGQVLKLFVAVEDFDVDRGFRNVHPDAGSIGMVRLSFDAGFFFDGEHRGVLRWRADYRDDVRQLESEGGEIWVDRHSTSCR